MSMSQDDVISRLDDKPAPPSARAEIVYRLLLETNIRDELVNEVMSQYKRGFQDLHALADLTERLSAARDRYLHSSAADLYHLAWGMLPINDNLEGLLAEFYYEWAGTLGIPEDRTTKIIREIADF